MNRIIKWGLIGLGNASFNLASEFKNTNNSELIAIASKTKDKLEQFKKNLIYQIKMLIPIMTIFLKIMI